MTIYSCLTCFLPSNPLERDLTLDGVDVSACIVDMHAQVCMAQRFTNPFQVAVQATYSFAVLASSAICDFEMVRGNGSKVLGKVMEKKAAKQAYETAVSQGKTASLGEEQTKDVFTIKVGNILALETVTINITFLTPLLDDERRDQVRFTFPRGYASRYATPPTADAAKAFPTAGSSQALNISVMVQQSNPIKAISCPSAHPIQFSLGHPDGVDIDSAIPGSHFAHVTMTSPTSFLTQDFVLIVTADGLDAPRCFAEPLLKPNEDTTAFGMTFVPRFSLPDVEGGMEFIFLVDRSGSMRGVPITLVREALIVLFRGLPMNNTIFNVFSFGSSVSSLWPASKEYTQATLEEATEHVDSMQANFGGTEIRLALNTVIESLPQRRQKAVSIFLLTDGSTWDVSGCMDDARQLVTSPGLSARIFTVGIGRGVSTNTVDSIARAGDGVAVYVQNDESMTGKLARLVRAARTPAIQDIEVLWPKDEEEDFEFIEKPEKAVKQTNADDAQAPISLYSEEDINTEYDVGPPPKPVVKPEDVLVPAIQRAPLRIPGLFPGTRSHMYAIISSLKTVPSSIKVRGKLSTTGGIIDLDIPVSRALVNVRSHRGFIHTLAARAMITDREDGKHQFDLNIVGRSELLQAHLDADVIRLGTRYGLTSRYTSYIAIDEHNQFQQPTGMADLASPPPAVPPPPSRSQPVSSALSMCRTAPSILPRYKRGIVCRESTPEVLTPVASVIRSECRWSSSRSPSVGNAASSLSVASASGSSADDSYLVAKSSAVPSSDEDFNFSDLKELKEKKRSTIEPSPPPSTLPQNNESLLLDSLLEKLRNGGAAATGSSEPLLAANLLANLKLGSTDALPPARSRRSRRYPSPDRSQPDNIPTQAAGIEMKKGLVGVARLQQFDGSFELSDQLLVAIGTKNTTQAIEEAFAASGSMCTKAIATAMALVWLKKEAAEEAVDMIEKAEMWLKKTLGSERKVKEVNQVAGGLQ